MDEPRTYPQRVRRPDGAEAVDHWTETQINTHVTKAAHAARMATGRPLTSAGQPLNFVEIDHANIEAAASTHRPDWPHLLDALAEHAEGRRAPHIMEWAQDTATLQRSVVEAAQVHAAARTRALGGGVKSVPSQRRTVLAVVLAILTLGVTLMGVLDPLPARAATTPAMKGPGLTLKAEGRSVHVGPYRLAGHLLWCLDWGLQVGDGPVRQGTPPVRLDAETRARVAWIVNSHSVVTDNRTAARVKLALDTIMAPTDARLRKALPGMLAQMTPADRLAISNPKALTNPREVPGIVERSLTHAPYRVTSSLPGAVTGQPGTLTVTVLGSNGKPAPGLAVSAVLTGAATRNPVTGRTNTKGQVALGYTASRLAQSAAVTVTGPSSTAVWANNPSAGHQHMIGGGFTATAKSSATVTVCPLRAHIGADCACGQKTAKVTLDVAGQYPGSYLVTISIDGKLVQEIPIHGAEKQTISVEAPLGAVVTAGFVVLGNTGAQVDGGTLATVSIR